MPPESFAGIDNPGTVHLNPTVDELIEFALKRDEGVIAANGALVAKTGSRTGRSPKDRFLVKHGAAVNEVDWGPVNQPFDPDAFDALGKKIKGHLSGKDVFVIDGYVGADPAHDIKLRVVAEYAWHALFCKQLFRRLDESQLEGFEPDFMLVSAPTFHADPSTDGTNSEAFIGLDVERKQVLICGTEYAGEMKKSLFTAGNYLLPLDGVLTMHCSANIGSDPDDVALFFGLSGTGKTTLSADPERRLIGDDEHGWSGNGIFNFEGGCYAKCVNLSQKNEPQIWDAIRHGSVLENVVLDDSGDPDYNDTSLTENTRAAYPLEYIPNFIEDGRAGHAQTVIFLTADAFGVLPPLSKLTPEAAMYHFLSGFTAKLAGTEAGMGSEPEATFSTCFGAPFLPLRPEVYAKMLGERIAKHDAEVFLVNTGWTGGPYGVGQRMSLPDTRAMVKAATSGALRGVETKRHPIFNVDVPVTCPGVSDDVLDPKSTWSDPAAYDQKARELANMFVKNFERFSDKVKPETLAAGPITG